MGGSSLATSSCSLYNKWVGMHYTVLDDEGGVNTEALMACSLEMIFGPVAHDDDDDDSDEEEEEEVVVVVVVVVVEEEEEEEEEEEDDPIMDCGEDLVDDSQ